MRIENGHLWFNRRDFVIMSISVVIFFVTDIHKYVWEFFTRGGF